ncbi:MAG: S8 family serine peptidase [Verrucomicrobiaceae bacterium]|nr:S8 family serine peptidase [Verrucomicrobiaceae bacterium]
MKLPTALAILLAAIAPLSTVRSQTATVTVNGAKCIAGRVLLKPKATASAAALQSTHTRSAAVAVDTVGTEGFVRASVNAAVSLEKVIADYQASGLYEVVEPDYILKASAVPNDQLFSQQWGMHQNNDIDIDAPEAWDRARDSRSIVIANTDTGGDLTHPDLVNNLWVNRGEIPGNNRDDDGNGYVDDIHGINTVNRSRPPQDDNGHGTHTAGTIGAEGGNGIGCAGVSHQARIMHLKFLDSTGSGATSDAVELLKYAQKMGAKVVNASWGGYYPSTTLRAQITAMERAGIIICAAAGNDAANTAVLPSYPAAYPNANIISVGASTRSDTLAWFSNWGADVDLEGPGENIISTWIGGSYRTISGTSMATPHVTGAVALIWAAAPSESWQNIKQRILSTVDKVPAFNGRTVTGGRLNLARALGGQAAPAKLAVFGNNNQIGNNDLTPWTGDSTDFGSISVVNSPGITRSFTITNQGGTGLSLGTANLSGDNPDRFTIVTRNAALLNPGQSTTLTIRYSGIREGTHSSLVRFTTSDPGVPTMTFKIQGTGIITADDAPNEVPNYKEISLNSTTSGSLEFERDNDIYRVYCPTSGYLDCYTSGSTNTFGHIYDGARSNYKLLTEDNDSAGNGNFRCRIRVDRGYYFIRVRSYGGGPGAYRLVVRF